MKIAIVHEWLTIIGGSDICVAHFAEMYPSADIFVLVADPKSLKKLKIDPKRVNTSFIQKLPFGIKKYKSYLPLFPLAIEQFDLSEYDLILSSSHAVAKGILTHSGQKHICYCHSPIRYAWDLYHQYLKESGLNKGIKGLFAKLILHYIRNWDVNTHHRVDGFIANSRYIGKRIERVYGKKSETIYPPVEVNDFTLCAKKEDIYFTASRMVPYKKIDIIVKTFTKMPNKKLVVIGDGMDFKKIKKIAKNHSNINLMGYQPFEIMKDYMQRAKAFIFMAEEDFGIVPVEAQACGTPVIAFGKGGALETVKGKFIDEKLEEGDTGIFFRKQTVESLTQAIDFFNQNEELFEPKNCRNQAMQFDTKIFRRNIAETIKKLMNQK